MCVSDYRFNQVKTERDKIPLFYMNKLNYEIISGSFSPPTQHLRKLSCFHSIRFDFDWNWQEITQPSLSIHEQGKWSGSDSGHDLVVIFFILAHFSPLSTKLSIENPSSIQWFSMNSKNSHKLSSHFEQKCLLCHHIPYIRCIQFGIISFVFVRHINRQKFQFTARIDGTQR